MSISIRVSNTAEIRPATAPTLLEWWRRLRRSRTAVFGLVITLIFVFLAIVGPFIAPYGPTRQSLINQLQPPSAQFWLGTDELGRDILSRLLVGAQLSLSVSLAATLIAAIVGTVLGAVGAFHGKWLDHLIMRVMDVLLALPGILLALAIIAALGTGLINVVLAIGVQSIPAFARLAHGSTLSAKEQDYVLAARAVGVGDARIIMQHIMPNISAPIVVQFSLRIATAVLTAAGLSFLGLGAQPPTPEWGAMLTNARTYMVTAPHTILAPGLAILFTVLGLNLLGDGIRDVLDPRLKT
ncbi:MAG: ABC transporter permease [Chloroflexota bacterium]